jgi:catechol 2,3-dioxygenase-like lactoylglutathione lyase family enzyme
MISPVMQRIVTGIHHVSIAVTDLELSRRFYTQVLGLREIPRPATFDLVVVWYDLGAQHIHLVPRETADAPSPRHFALQVALVACLLELQFGNYAPPFDLKHPSGDTYNRTSRGCS